MPIFLSGRPDDPAQPEQPVKSSKHSEPLQANGFVSKSDLKVGREGNGETGDWGLNGAAAAEDGDDEGGDQNL